MAVTRNWRECQDEVEEERLIVGQDLPDGVFTVERLASL